MITSLSVHNNCINIKYENVTVKIPTLNLLYFKTILKFLCKQQMKSKRIPIM